MKLHIEWDLSAAKTPAEVGVIVDCLSFSTALTVGSKKNARVYPFAPRDYAEQFAKRLNLDCAAKRKQGGLTLSPPSLLDYRGNGLVLPSPNGSRLSLAAVQDTVFCGCLRNATAVAKKLMRLQGSIILIAAGERWRDGSLRPCFEDWIACGAIASKIEAEKTPETMAAIAAYEAIESDILTPLRKCESGVELISHGYTSDVEWAGMIDADQHVPQLRFDSRTYQDVLPEWTDCPPGNIRYYQV